MNLTQEELAEAFGVTVGAVSKWESGSTVPDIMTMMELADFFNISMDILLGYNMSSKRIDDITQRIFSLTKEQKYEEAVSEAEKALVRYPASFKIITLISFAIATSILLKFSILLSSKLAISIFSIFKTEFASSKADA